MLPSSTTGSSAFSSGAASGFGRVTTTVVVVLAVVELVELVEVVLVEEVELDVDVVGATVVDVVVDVAADVAAGAAVDSSPHAASAANAAPASAIQSRRIPTVCQRLLLQQRRRRELPTANACRNADAVVAGTGNSDPARK